MATLTPEDVRRVFDQCGTDKGQHGYAGFYASLRPPKVLLEIGIAEGASLMAWRRLWPDAHIIGVDIDISRVRPGVADSRTNIIGANPARQALFFTDLDLIIDDGSHYLQDQMLARARLLPSLAERGVYVVEDVFPENIDGLMLPGWEMLNTSDGTGDRVDDRLVFWRGAAEGGTAPLEKVHP